MNSLTLKRRFWTVAKGTVRANILRVDRLGYIFKHPQVQVTTRYGYTHDFTLNLSLGKLPSHVRNSAMGLLKQRMYEGNPVLIQYEQHLLGNPLVGVTVEPAYLLSVADTLNGN